MSNKNIEIIDTNRDELNKLERDELYDLCIKNRIVVFRLLSKKEYIEILLAQKERLIQEKNSKEEFKQLVGGDSRNGAHGYRLPVFIITQIFRYYWILCTQPYRAPTFDGPSGYPLAFRLLSLNKQFFDLVSQWFNRIKSIPWKTTCFDRPWCPIKKIVKLNIDINNVKNLVSNNKHIASRIFQSVDKLSITTQFPLSIISSTCLNSLSVLAPNLVSFKPYKVRLELEHFMILASFPNLVKVNFLYLSIEEFHLRSISLFLEKPMVKFLFPTFPTIFLTKIEKYETFRNSIQVLGHLSSFKKKTINIPKGINFPMLRKLYFHCQCSKEKLKDLLNYFDANTIENINHFGFRVCSKGELLYQTISKMKRLQVIEYCSVFTNENEEVINYFISELEQYGVTPTTLILNSESSIPLEKYKFYRKSSNNYYYDRFYYSKINK